MNLVNLSTSSTLSGPETTPDKINQPYMTVLLNNIVPTTSFISVTIFIYIIRFFQRQTIFYSVVVQIGNVPQSTSVS